MKRDIRKIAHPKAQYDKKANLYTPHFHNSDWVRKEALKYMETHTWKETAKIFHVSEMTLSRWKKKFSSPGRNVSDTNGEN